MPAYTISNSDGSSLHFTDNDEDLYYLYKYESKKLDDLFYALLRQRNGVYADNQGRYLKPPETLNSIDSKEMEERFTLLNRDIINLKRI